MCFLLPWGCTSHDELVYHPAHPISRFKLPTVSECKAGLQGSGVLFFFFLASGGTLLISSDYVPPKTSDLHDCHFIKTSRHHVKTILFRRIRHSESHFPRLLQRNLHARQLLWMLFLAALQHTKPSKRLIHRSCLKALWFRSTYVAHASSWSMVIVFLHVPTSYHDYVHPIDSRTHTVAIASLPSKQRHSIIQDWTKKLYRGCQPILPKLSQYLRATSSIFRWRVV